MRSLARIVVTLIVGLATFYFMFWLGFSLILPSDGWLWIRGLGSLLCACVAARYVWSRSVAVARGWVRSVVLGALITGGIGFVGGFFGPILFAPDANQGPLLGIFITGPLGVLLGAVGGLVHGLVQSRRKSAFKSE